MCTVSAKPKSTGYGSRYKSFLVRCPSSHSRKKCLQREDRGSAIPCFKPARLHPCELVPNPLGQPWERTWHMQRLLRQALCFPGLTREPASQSMDTVVLQVREIKGLHIIIDRHRRRTLWVNPGKEHDRHLHRSNSWVGPTNWNAWSQGNKNIKEPKFKLTKISQDLIAT